MPDKMFREFECDRCSATDRVEMAQAGSIVDVPAGWATGGVAHLTPMGPEVYHHFALCPTCTIRALGGDEQRG